MATEQLVRLVYKRRDGRWAWNVRVDGMVIAADGTSGYETEQEARAVADALLGGTYAEAERKTRREASDGQPPTPTTFRLTG